MILLLIYVWLFIGFISITIYDLDYKRKWKKDFGTDYKMRLGYNILGYVTCTFLGPFGALMCWLYRYDNL
jgi:hypothetical protein